MTSLAQRAAVLAGDDLVYLLPSRLLVRTQLAIYWLFVVNQISILFPCIASSFQSPLSSLKFGEKKKESEKRGSVSQEKRLAVFKNWQMFQKKFQSIQSDILQKKEHTKEVKDLQLQRLLYCCHSNCIQMLHSSIASSSFPIQLPMAIQFNRLGIKSIGIQRSSTNLSNSTLRHVRSLGNTWAVPIIAKFVIIFFIMMVKLFLF